MAVVSGGLSGDHYNQDSVIVLNEKKICSQPDFWSGMSVMPRHRWGHVTTFMETVFIVCGGTTDLEGIVPNNTCDAFNLSSRSWEEFDDMLELRHQVRVKITVYYIKPWLLFRLLASVPWVTSM